MTGRMIIHTIIRMGIRIRTHGRVTTTRAPRRNGRPRICRRDMSTIRSRRPSADLDLVEASFVEGFTRCFDATSFLRLAGIPFACVAADGRRLHLLRVEIEDLTDVGTAVPLLGGKGMRYDPLPEKLVSRRRHLSFVYHDGTQLVRLGFTEVRALVAV